LLAAQAVLNLLVVVERAVIAHLLEHQAEALLPKAD
jgi:hypothetical protein